MPRPCALCTAGAEGGWVDTAPALPGDLHVVELDGKHGWCVARLGWIASSSTVAMNPDAPPLQALFGGGEGFLNYAHGQGSVVLACYGALDLVTLADGEAVTIGSDHVVAFADTVQCRLRAFAFRWHRNPFRPVRAWCSTSPVPVRC